MRATSEDFSVAPTDSTVMLPAMAIRASGTSMRGVDSNA